MSKTIFKFSRLVLVASLSFVLLIFSNSAFAAQKVPISFDDYHGYTGTVTYIKAVAKAYPNITSLLEIGKSTMGRSIYVLVISNMNKGTTIDAHVPLSHPRKEGVKNVTPQKPYQGKPGHWICGSTHGNEYTGTEVCLYSIDKLVSGYGSDEEITRLVDEQTFYICPVVNPDGLYNSVERGISQRQNSEKKDDDGDGKINEDDLDDLNGDGFITQFRYKDPQGNYIVDEEDSRLMVRLRPNQKTEAQRYSVIREDRDNDSDGQRGEDPERGIDLNRNYPEGWWNDTLPGGSGTYPTSSPEVQAMAEFFMNHTNILMAQNFHTSGGFTYRPMGTAPHTAMHPKDVAVFDFIMGKKYLEIIGEEVPEAWICPARIPSLKAKLKSPPSNKYDLMRGYDLPRGWRVSYNEDRDQRYSFGMATDWMYVQLGIYALTTELWNPQRDIPDFPQLQNQTDRSGQQRILLKYQDEKYGGRLFLPWKAFNHPELGQGEIGGWIPNYQNNAWPGDPLRHVCENHWQFELFRAGLQPNVVITDAQAKVLYTANNASESAAAQKGDQVTINKGKSVGRYKIVEVTATIENKGKLATHIARGAQIPENRQDVVWLIGDPGKITYMQGTAFQQLGVLEGAMAIPGYGGRAAGGPARGQAQVQQMMPMMPGMPMQRRFGERFQPTQVNQPGSTRTVKWLIAVEGNSPLKIVFSSQKGGTKVKDVSIENGGAK